MASTAQSVACAIALHGGVVNIAKPRQVFMQMIHEVMERGRGREFADEAFVVRDAPRTLLQNPRGGEALCERADAHFRPNCFEQRLPGQARRCSHTLGETGEQLRILHLAPFIRGFAQRTVEWHSLQLRRGRDH
jgi:hypothetical protein